MWRKFNPNPCGKSIGDCAVRAICAALNLTWDDAFDLLCAEARKQCDMPSSNSVWGAVLRQNGFSRKAIPDTCPDCYTFEDFARDNPEGVFVLGTGSHVATVKNGTLFDSWDSRQEVPQYVWYKPND